MLLGGVAISVGLASAAPGVLDPSFGIHGKVVTAFGPGSDAASDVVLQPDGKIVVAGIGDDKVAVARYTKSGILDPTFGAGGKVTTAVGSRSSAGAVTLQPDGKIVVAGRTTSGSDYAFALVRYTSTGALDPSFGTGGIVTTPFGEGFAGARAIVLQPDGKLVVAGIAGTDFALARYDSNGSLDPSFGEGGTLTTKFRPEPGPEERDDIVEALVIQPDGKLVAAGWTDSGANYDYALARYRTDGSLDPGFGSGGRVTTAIGPNHDLGDALVLQPDGKLVLAGFSETASGAGFGLVRYNADGSLDGGFGAGGKVVTGSNAGAFALALQPDGKLVAAGNSFRAGPDDYDFAVTRYKSNGAVDRAFGSRGTVTTSFGSGYDVATALALQPNGRIVVAGSRSTGSNQSSFALARYVGGEATCVVPRVTGATLAAAKRAITNAHCAVGTVSHGFSSTVKQGRVLSQKPNPGVRRAFGAKVNLIVSKGPKH
jgi:uncharacterized delta-60 repeat protein